MCLIFSCSNTLFFTCIICIPKDMFVNSIQITWGRKNESSAISVEVVEKASIANPDCSIF